MLPTLFCWRSTAQAIKVETNLAAQCSTMNRCLANPTPNPVPGGQASRRTTCPTPRSTTYPNPRIGAPTSLRQCSYSNNTYGPHKALRTGRPPPRQRQRPEVHEPSRQMQRQSADKVQDFSSARNERTSRLWARAGGSGAGSSGTFRAFCGSGAGSSGHFEAAQCGPGAGFDDSCGVSSSQAERASSQAEPRSPGASKAPEAP